MTDATSLKNRSKKPSRSVFLRNHALFTRLTPGFIAEILVLLTLFLLPFQTRYIFTHGNLRGIPSEAVTTSLYAVDLLILLTLTLTLVLWPRIVQRDTFQHGRLFFLAAAALWLVSFFSFVLGHNATAGGMGIWNLSIGMALGFLIVAVQPCTKRVLWTLTAAGGVQAIIGIIQWRLQRIQASTLLGIAAQFPETRGVQVIDTELYGRVLRGYGSLPHPNILAGFLVVCIIAGIVLFLRTEIKTKRDQRQAIWLAILLAVQSAGLWVSASRQAIIALLTVALACVAWQLLNRGRTTHNAIRLSVIILTPLILLTLLFPWFVSPRAHGLVSPNTQLEQISIDDRKQTISESVRMVRSYWDTGVGINNYTQYFATPVHNVYLLVLSEIGIVGLITFILLILSAAAAYVTQHSRAQQFALLALPALLIIMLFDHYLWSLHPGILLFWTVLGIGFILPANDRSNRKTADK